MAFAITGFKTVAQNWISRGIASNYYQKLPFLTMLAALSISRGNKTDPLEIGRPDGKIYAGRLLSEGDLEDLQNFNAYQPRIQQFETDNSKWMGKYDTTPTTANKQTRAHSQVGQASALFYRSRVKTPIWVWHSDKDRALTRESKMGQGLAMSKQIDESTQSAFQDHVKKLNTGIWSGSPTDQTEDPWDQPAGISEALDTTNTYGNVDRSSSANAAWRAQKDTTWTSEDIYALLDNANITKGLRTYGQGVDVIVCDQTRFLKFKRQIQSQSGPMAILKDGLPEFAKMGVKNEVLQVDNAYVIYDPTCPTNTVLALSMGTWKMMIAPGKNCNVSKFTDLSDKTEGASEADQAFIETEFIFSCDNPWLNVRYTAVGT